MSLVYLWGNEGLLVSLRSTQLTYYFLKKQYYVSGL